MALTLNGSGTIQADDITLSGNANVTGTMTSTGDLTASAALNATLTGNADSATKLSTASGSAPSYSARAWVSFNGTNGTINASGNISSVTDNNTGNFSANFTTAMEDTYYAVGYAGFETGSNGVELLRSDVNKTTTYFQCIIRQPGATTATDCDEFTFIIVR